MAWVKAGSAVVIVAQQFNPSIVSNHWLIQNRVLAEGDFLPGCVFTDVFAQVHSRLFDMLVVAEQIQFVPTMTDHDEQQVIVDKLGMIVDTLPHTPYRALGLNFTWHLIPGDGDIARASRALFFIPSNPLFSNFDAPNALFGGYMSKDLLGLRLKLDVKPLVTQLQDRVEHRLQFAFNYHLDLVPDSPAAAQIRDKLCRWNEVKREAERIIDAVEPRS
jgi:hypothetical protein